MLNLKNNVTALKKSKKRKPREIWSSLMDTTHMGMVLAPKKADVMGTIDNKEEALRGYKNWLRTDQRYQNHVYYKARVNETEDELKSLRKTAKKRGYTLR